MRQRNVETKKRPYHGDETETRDDEFKKGSGVKVVGNSLFDFQGPKEEPEAKATGV